ncbi:MAG: hypothetical protein F4X31_00790 [Gammaproteobacteria bacterium]|nr:hypothetical protein [Gammaproteobacteria bacterium]MYF12943.1 hypothetical protein [Gammaproteobacteria bacterium]
MDPRHTQILKDMGIEAWCLRRAAPVARQSPPMPAAPKEPAGARTEPLSTRRSASVPPAPRPAPPAAAAPAAKVPDATDAEPFTLTAFCTASEGGGALLATSGLTGRGQAALAADIVRCLSRNWSATVRRIEFNWPLPGVTGAAGPALSAFLDKQINDFSVTRALATQSAAARMPTLGIGVATIPDLNQLDSPDAKRALWRQLQAP